MTQITIAQLYPDQLGVTGDRGNVRALEVRLEAAGAEVSTHRVGPGDELPADLDILVVGNGPLSAMRGVHADLMGRGDGIRSFAEAGGALLAVGGGAELLSRGITTLDGESIDGVGVFDASVVRTRQRKVGYIVVDTPVGRVTGFEDYASEWSLAAPEHGYGRVQFGEGSFVIPDAGEPARGELVRERNAFASNVQGPLLPLNPELIREILTGVAAQRDVELDLTVGAGALDAYAAGARSAIETLVRGKGFHTIQL